MAKSEVYNTDCIEYMRTIPDNHFDIAVCDPPFGSANDDALIGVKKDFTKEECSRGITKWNRLKGGRRERYYSPIPRSDVGNEIQNGGV